MNRSQVLEMARQGDADAIGILMNQALEPRGVSVRALREQQCLHVLLEAATVPNPQLARLIRGGVTCLKSPVIQQLRVYGRKHHQTLPDWKQEWVLYPQAQVSGGATASSAVSPAPFPVQPSEPLTQLPVQSAVSAPSAPATNTPSPPHRPTRSRTSPRSTPTRSPMRFKSGILIPLTFVAGFVTGISWNRLTSSNANATLDQSSPNPASQSQVSPAPSTPPIASDSAPELATAVTPEANPEAAPPAPSSVSTPVSATTSSFSEPFVTIKAVGDIIPGTNFPNNRLPEQDGAWLFNQVKPFLDGADLLFGNFESTLTDSPYVAKDVSQGQTFAFRTPPSYAAVLQEVGFDVLSVANNHSLDFGDQGFADTIAHIQQAGMQPVGSKNQIVYTSANGVQIAVIGFSYFPDHNSILDIEAGKLLVEQAKQQADIVMISMHAGAEGTDAAHTRNESEFFFGENRGNLVEFAHAMIDQGADLVLGHGPHVPRAIELYNSRLIAYSLGNFLGYRTLSTDGTLSYSLILQVQLDAQGNFVTGKIIPVRLDAQGVPYIDDRFDTVRFVRNLLESDFPVTPLLIDDTGQILRNEAPI